MNIWPWQQCRALALGVPVIYPICRSVCVCWSGKCTVANGLLDPNVVWCGEWDRLRDECYRGDDRWKGRGSFRVKCGASHWNQWGLCCIVVRDRRAVPKVLWEDLLHICKWQVADAGCTLLILEDQNLSRTHVWERCFVNCITTACIKMACIALFNIIFYCCKLTTVIFGIQYPYISEAIEMHAWFPTSP